jgi:hypothetical protein
MLGRMARMKRPGVKVTLMTGYDIEINSHTLPGKLYPKPVDVDCLMTELGHCFLREHPASCVSTPQAAPVSIRSVAPRASTVPSCGPTALKPSRYSSHRSGWFSFHHGSRQPVNDSQRRG